ncbi:MAG: TIGR03960 family B12-binding radical SAM protein [bacterium]
MNDYCEIRSKLEDILPRVSKPGRYFAGEVGLVRKDWDSCRARAVIGFPDVYEIASGNLGHKLIRHIINKNDGFLAERVYAPWPDMEAKLRESGIPLYSLESFRPIKDFDIFGLSLTHELCFSNLLLMIDLAGLPLRAEDRGFPIIVAGGPSAFNPEPIADFLDAVVLGDGEEIAVRLMQTIAEFRNEIDLSRGKIEAEKSLKNRILDQWSGIPGVYIPSHFKIEYESDGKVKSIENIKGGSSVIKKAIVTDLNRAEWEIEPLIPHMQGVSNRVTIEPVRGCTQGCRFCQAGMIYRPWRTRSVDLLVDQAEHLLKHTGLQEQSFLALSATDWPELGEFVERMQKKDRDFHLKISLPSGRIDSLTEEIISQLVENRKGGLTLAIEAGTQRLRDIINKRITDDEIENAIRIAVVSGWNLIKLYFMIGLPSETDEDVSAIFDFIEDLIALRKRLKSEGFSAAASLKLKVSVSSFVPKAHTPFQWSRMNHPEELEYKQKMLIGLRRIRGVEYSLHDIGASWLESMLSRGDRRLSDIIEKAYMLGARFDAWGDMCKPDLWGKAFEESGLNPEWYLRERDLDEIFPWDHISCGVDKDWLKREWLRSIDAKTTPDCNESVCLKCGMSEMLPECKPQRVIE